MEDLQKLVRSIPHNPGVYKFLNNQNTLIYVGKAKDLRKRVASYFTSSRQHSRKTKKLVSEIKDIEFVITGSEFDALLLENNLIKTNQPKYNILLKDDKSFPYLCVTNQRFPRIYSTRKLDRSKGDYYGPYTSAVNMRSVLELVNRLYTLRTCKYTLSEENIKNKKFKICLEYHIGNCKGPCEGLQDEEDYKVNLEQAINILKGDLSTPRKLLEDQMKNYAAHLEFEQAEEIRIKLEQLNSFYNKSVVVNPKLKSLFVVGIVSNEKKAYVNFLQVKNGSITQSKSLEIKKQLDENDRDLVVTSVAQLIDEIDTLDQINIISNLEVEEAPYPIVVEVPKIGDKRKLVDMAIKNAMFLKKNSEQKSEEPTYADKVLLQLQQVLNLTTIPKHIECFDNSNIQGSNPVASMVCFKNGKPSKSDYRKFKIKTVEGPDDFASMREVVGRRYSRVIKENDSLPNLVLIDGGKGQLGAAVEALKEVGIYGQVAIAGIAKRLEEIYIPGDQLPVHISKKSPALKLLQQLRDEAHRFAITFHRDRRSKGQINSWLNDIDGIGNKTVDLLLKKFKSPEKIKNTSIEEIEQLIGKYRARLLFKHIKKASE